MVLQLPFSCTNSYGSWYGGTYIAIMEDVSVSGDWYRYTNIVIIETCCLPNDQGLLPWYEVLVTTFILFIFIPLTKSVVSKVIYVLIFPRSLPFFMASLNAFELDMYGFLCMHELTCIFLTNLIDNFYFNCTFNLTFVFVAATVLFMWLRSHWISSTHIHRHRINSTLHLHRHRITITLHLHRLFNPYNYWICDTLHCSITFNTNDTFNANGPL